MSETTPRQASVNITYTPKGSKTNRTESTMAEYNEGFTYTDAATGQSDTISLKVNNRDLRWANKWIPKKGDKIIAVIKAKSWTSAGADQSFTCGKFCCDDITYTGPQLTCEIGGVSVPEGQAFRSTERTYTWERVTIEEMARKIGKRYGLAVHYDAKKINIKSMEQKGKNDCDFLNGVCNDYGLYIKVYYGKIIIYDVDAYEEKKAVRTFSINDFGGWSYNTTLVGTYTGATIKYTRGDDDKELSLTVGGGNRILNISEKVDSKADAELRACARVNKENREAVTMSVTVTADFKIAAGVCIQIKDAYQLNGKYFVDKVKHSIDAKGAYTMDLELHKVQTKIKAKTTKSSMKKTKQKKKTYKVGDIVQFKGGTHYVSSWKGAKGYPARAGKAKITMGPNCAGNGKAHPWHLIHTDSGSNVYGWVDEGTFE